MIKDYFEDARRRKFDRLENNRDSVLVDVLADGDLEGESGSQSKTPWHSLKTGQLVKVNKNDFFPADIILLASSAPGGVCFVETKNLDGETNLKHKIAPKELLDFDSAA